MPTETDIIELLKRVNADRHELAIAEFQIDRSYQDFARATERAETIRKRMEADKAKVREALFTMLLHTPHRRFYAFMRAHT